MIIELPWPPSVNNYWTSRAVYAKKKKTTTKTNGKLSIMKTLSERARAFRKTAIDECLVQGAINKALKGPLAVKLELYPPKNFRYDADNFCKGVLDALTHANVYGDDCQVEDLHIRKMFKVPDGKVIVQIEPFSNPHSSHNQIDLLG